MLLWETELSREKGFRQLADKDFTMYKKGKDMNKITKKLGSLTVEKRKTTLYGAYIQCFLCQKICFRFEFPHFLKLDILCCAK